MPPSQEKFGRPQRLLPKHAKEKTRVVAVAVDSVLRMASQIERAEYVGFLQVFRDQQQRGGRERVSVRFSWPVRLGQGSLAFWRPFWSGRSDFGQVGRQRDI